MNEYRFTATDRVTGKTRTDQMRAENVDEVRAFAENLGVDIESIVQVHRNASGEFDAFLLGFGQLVSIIGCASPLIYLLLVLSGSVEFSGFGLFLSFASALYSAAMRVVFSRVSQNSE